MLLVLALSELLASQDFSGMNVAAPAIGAAFNIGPQAISWVISAAVLAQGGLLVVGGRLADMFSRRRMFLIGLATLVVGSLISAVAPNLPVLLLGRVIQGAAFAMKLPATLALVFEVLPPGSPQNRALGLITFANILGVALGAVIGGVLVHAIGWRGVMLLDLVSASLTLAVAPRMIPIRPGETGRRRALDPAAAVLVTAGLVSLVWLISATTMQGLVSWQSLVALVLAVLLLAGFVLRERVSEDPLVPVAMFRFPNVIAGNVVVGLMNPLVTGNIFLLSLFLQQRAHVDPRIAGLTFVSMSVGALASQMVIPRLVRAIGNRLAIIIGFLILGGLACLLTTLRPGNALLVAFLVMLIQPAGTMLVIVGSFAEAIGNVSPDLQGVASAVVTDVRQCSVGIGITLFAALLARVGYPATFVAVALLALPGILVALSIRSRPAPGMVLPARS